MDEPSLGLDVELELLVRQRRLRADAADRRLDVLRLHRIDDVVRREAVARHAVAVEPDAHAVVGGREQATRRRRRGHASKRRGH